MNENNKELTLTILLTVVSGKEAVRRCLNVLLPQINFEDSEIIVTFDEKTQAVGSLAAEFCEVRFHFIEDLDLAAYSDISAREHRLYDRRRAVGLGLSRGRIIAMTEDYAEPAKDWYRQILAAHKQPYAVIGGAIENAIDTPLNNAWYYCDFGRYGKPLTNGEADYVSDINVSYKREALEAVRDVWQDAYHETTVHWTMQKRGIKLFLDERLVVFQKRPLLSLSRAWRERIDWGRIFAETRASEMSSGRRFMFACGTIFLLPLLTVRAVRHMRRQKKTALQITKILPYLLLLLSGWVPGEFAGYLTGEPKRNSGTLSFGIRDEKVIG